MLEADLTIDFLKDHHPAIVAAIADEAAAAERERIKVVEEAALPGHDELLAKLKFDGKTTAQEAALAINMAERERRRRLAENEKVKILRPSEGPEV